MRLMGSFQTSTIHGTSGSVNVSPTGWSTSTGAVVMPAILADGGRGATGRRLASCRREHGGGGRFDVVVGLDRPLAAVALGQSEAERHHPDDNRAEDVGGHQ